MLEQPVPEGLHPVGRIPLWGSSWEGLTLEKSVENCLP